MTASLHSVPSENRWRRALWPARAWLLCASLALLGACGGGKPDSSAKSAEPQNTQASSVTPDAALTGTLLKQAAAVNKADLERAAASESAALSGQSAQQRKAASGAAKFVGTRVPVYRFYSALQSAHFYTASAAEAQLVRDGLLYMREEGIAFYASSTPAAGLSPVHRYFNTRSYTHFFTISAEEKVFIDANIPSLRYDGIAFYASQTAGNGLLGLTRFFQTAMGTHFYTRSAAEAQDVRNRLSALYREEGLAFYVLDPAYVASTTNRLPHSGVTAAQCYQAGSNALVACSSAGATTLNSQQDGHRTAVDPMSYSEVPNPAGGHFARTECVRDNVTGLIWEGKTTSGDRAGSNFYTNYDDKTLPQRYDSATGRWVNPTQSEIDAPTNSGGFKNYVNSIALCGYTDWRLPTVDELQGIVDYRITYPGPTINTEWFPNGLPMGDGTLYWTSSPYLGFFDVSWVVDFFSGAVSVHRRDGGVGVRLVRGSQ